MKKLFLVFMLIVTPMLADMGYDKANNCFFSTFLFNTNDQIEYNALMMNFIQGLADYINGHQTTQNTINSRFGTTTTQVPVDINNYFVIFINSLASYRNSWASIALQQDLQQPQTVVLLKSLFSGQ